MNVFLRLELACSPDAAWDALRDPNMLVAASAPLMRLRSKDPLPTQWDDQKIYPVSLSLFGVIPLGRRTIDVTYSERPGGVRMLIDQGESLSGPMRMLHDWDHRMAISPGSNRTTLYRDRLVVKAGIFTFPMWLGLWMVWQYRARHIKRLARSWDKKN